MPNRFFTEDHEWVEIDGDIATIEFISCDR